MIFWDFEGMYGLHWGSGRLGFAKAVGLKCCLRKKKDKKDEKIDDFYVVYGDWMNSYENDDLDLNDHWFLKKETG